MFSGSLRTPLCISKTVGPIKKVMCSDPPKTVSSESDIHVCNFEFCILGVVLAIFQNFQNCSKIFKKKKLKWPNYP